MSIVKDLFRVFILSILFTVLKFAVDMVMSIIIDDSTNIQPLSYYISTSGFTFYSYVFNFSIGLFLPLLLSSLAFKLTRKQTRRNIYWIISVVPISLYTYMAFFTVIFMGIEYKFLFTFLLPLYIFLMFYYNYKMLNKESEKKES
ncbi:MAG: hypothetical protein WDA08_00425 [Weeksellaceae bacterium]